VLKELEFRAVANLFPVAQPEVKFRRKGRSLHEPEIEVRGEQEEAHENPPMGDHEHRSSFDLRRLERAAHPAQV
jgi:hypothetical protein